MRFRHSQFGWASRRVAGSLPLSTLLLAALCVMLATPASHAASQDETRVAILTRVIAASATSSEISTRLSALETRQVKVFLSRLQTSDSQFSLSDSLCQLQRDLAKIGSTPTIPVVLPPTLFHTPPHPPTTLTAHEAAQLSGVRTNSFPQ